MVKHYYLDSSVAVRILLGESPASVDWFNDASLNDMVISSRILRTELTRVLRRESRDISERDLILDYIWRVDLDHAILIEAEGIVPHVKTLDAIHLASALRTGIDDLAVVSHDSNMKSVARQLALDVFDPVL